MLNKRGKFQEGKVEENIENKWKYELEKAVINKIGLLFLQEEPKFDAKIYALTYVGIEPNVPTNCVLFVGCSRKEAHALAYDLKFRTDLSAKLGKFFSSTLDFFGIGKKINRGIYWKN